MHELLKQLITSVLVLEARFLLRRVQPTVIAVTGNVGKTSTKDAIYTALNESVSIRKSHKSYNTDLGVALTVLGIQGGEGRVWSWPAVIVDGLLAALFQREYPTYLVLEMGVDRPGDMQRLGRWIHPHIVVLTHFPSVPAHVEYFASPEAVIEEKMTLLTALRDDGVVIFNHDDALIRRALAEVRQEQIGFSRLSPSQYQLIGHEVHYDEGTPTGMTCHVQHIDETVPVTIAGSLGLPQLYAAAAALAVAGECGVSLEVAATALGGHLAPLGRMRLVAGVDSVQIIDDSYNASPSAMQEALLALQELEVSGRKMAIVGDMLELGRYSVAAHEAVGVQAATTVDALVTVGVRARVIARAALEQGMSGKNILQFDTAEQAAEEVRRQLKTGDTILVKGSQGMRLEKVVKRLMQNPDEARKLLVRQDAGWLRR